MTQITFKTIDDALTAGYKRVNRATDRDISGGNYFGYQYQSPSGEKTVTVWFTDVPSMIGADIYGSFLPMYPPKEPLPLDEEETEVDCGDLIDENDFEGEDSFDEGEYY